MLILSFLQGIFSTPEFLYSLTSAKLRLFFELSLWIVSLFKISFETREEKHEEVSESLSPEESGFGFVFAENCPPIAFWNNWGGNDVVVSWFECVFFLLYPSVNILRVKGEEEVCSSLLSCCWKDSKHPLPRQLFCAGKNGMTAPTVAGKNFQPQGVHNWTVS